MVQAFNFPGGVITEVPLSRFRSISLLRTPRQIGGLSVLQQWVLSGCPRTFIAVMASAINHRCKPLAAELDWVTSVPLILLYLVLRFVW